MKNRILITTKDSELRNNASIGKWNDFSSDFSRLEKIFKLSQTNCKNITSIPSPMSRFVLFKDAINSKHPLHDRLMSQVLDILEIIFFKETLYYQIIREKVPLINSKSKILSKIENFAEMNKMDSIELIYMSRDGINKFLLGAISPYTLFVTPFDKRKLNEVNNRYFKKVTPIPERPLTFQKYLNHLVNEYRESNHESSISRFINYLGKELTKSDIKETINGLKKFGEFYGLNLYYLKDKYLESPLLLNCDKIQSQTKPMILYQHHHNDLYYNNYRFDNNFTLSELTDLPRDILPNEIIKYPWISPFHDWFEDVLISSNFKLNTEDLYYFETEKFAGKTATYLIPFKKEFLHYFSPNYIENNLMFEILHDSVKVKLNLPVGDNEIMTIKKNYLPNNIKEIELPMIAIWPKVHPKLWGNNPYYMIVHSNDNLGKFDFNFFGEHEEEIPEDKQTRVNKTDKTAVYMFNLLPAAIKISYKGISGFQFINYDNLFSEVSNDITNTKVGLDFGTSNTTVFINIDGDVDYLNFNYENSSKDVFNKTDFIYLNDLNDEDIASIVRQFNETMRLYYLPQFITKKSTTNRNSASNPFMSFLQIDDKENIKEEPLLKARIPFEGNIYYNHKIVGDLKWRKKSVQSNRNTRIFLKEIFLLVYYYLVKKKVKLDNNVIFNYSYPKSFTRAQKHKLDVIWEDFCNDQSIEHHNSYDESTASLAYFVEKHQLNPHENVTNLIIDIGGGTSDISVFHENKYIINFSIPFAGNDLHSWKSTYYQTSILLDFLEKTSKDGNSKLSENNRLFGTSLTQNHLKFNFLASQLDDKTITSLISQSEFNKEQFLLLYFLSVIIYDIGMQLRQIDESYITEKIDLYLGGNGSRFAHWLDNGNWDNPKHIINFLIKIFNKSLGNHTNISRLNLKISESPKTEVAYGLCKISDLENIFNEPLKEEYEILIGENIIYKNQSYFSTNRMMEITNKFNFVSTDLSLDSNSSELMNFHNCFLEEIEKKSKEIFDWNLKNLQFISDLKETINENLEGFIRYQAYKLFDETEDLKSSFFILGAKECIGLINSKLKELEE